jgi:Ca-activated chloride channel family protein
MNFERIQYLPLVIVAIAIVIIFFTNNYPKYNKLIKDYWFKVPRFKHYLSIGFYLLGLLTLLLALLDIRGEPIKMESPIPEQKTVIMIDNSLSMMAEDIRPNRLERAILFARHFSKKAIGHQISVLIFSDTHKKLVPFTSDHELIDSRLAGLKEMNITMGGTNLSLAINEALGYLKKENSITGNLLIISDAEENEIPAKLNIPDTVNVGFIGVGTEKGAAIPLRTKNGLFMSYKSHQGQEVKTRLDIKRISELANDIKNFKYWIISSYSLPTDEVIAYFDTLLVEQMASKEIVVKPVLGHHVIAIGLLMIGLSLLMKIGRQYKSAIMIFLYLFNLKTFAHEKKQKELSLLGRKLLSKVKQGEAKIEEKFKLAEEFLKTDYVEQAYIIYKENKDEIKAIENLFNFATSSMLSKEINKGLAYYKSIMDESSNQEIIELARKNILIILAQNEDQSGDDNQEQKSRDKSDKGESDSQGNGNKEKGESDDKNDESQSEENDDNQMNNDNEEKKEKEEQKQNDNQKQDVSKQEVPSLLKQLIQDDRQLQKKLLDTTTGDKLKPRDKKDW